VRSPRLDLLNSHRRVLRRKRDIDVLKLVLDRSRNRECTYQVVLGGHRVGKHLSCIYKDLGVSSCFELSNRLSTEDGRTGPSGNA
jgi:hypothetical protein